MRAYAVQFLSNAALFGALLFVPNFAQEFGASEVETGVVVGLHALALLLSSYVFGRLADVRGRREFLRLGLVLSALTMGAHLLVRDVVTLAAARVAVGVAGGMFPPALLAHAYETNIPMGRFAAANSAGWAVGSLLAGALSVTAFSPLTSMQWTFLVATLLLVVCALLSWGLTFPREVRLAVPRFPAAVLRRNWSVYAAVLVRHTGANMIWVIFPLYLEHDLGLDRFLIGVLYVINTATQVVVMAAVERVGSARLVTVGLAAALLTFLSFTVARNFWAMAPTQVLLGFSWATLYVGALKLVLGRNVERATASGLLGSAVSLAAAGGPFLGGLLSDAGGRPATFYAAAAMAATALALFHLGRERSKRRTVSSR